MTDSKHLPNKKFKSTDESILPVDECLNFINGTFVHPVAVEKNLNQQPLPVLSPTTDAVIGHVVVSSAADVDVAVGAAKQAFPHWSGLTIKARAAIMFRFHALVREHAEEIADIVVLESGKNKAEALASVAKGQETVEWACSLPQLIPGQICQVSRGITCHEVKEPMGVVASIVPFNFPAMVPMWTVPIALTLGNCMILKPSEKVPFTMTRMTSLLAQAGVPPGVFQLLNGSADVAMALCRHPQISAVTFVGSSPIAERVSQSCRQLNKKVLALGGAKNHLVLLEDVANVEGAARDIVASFAGCAGQRCMAASVLLVVGHGTRVSKVISSVVSQAAALSRGTDPGQVGAIIDAPSKDKILSYLDEVAEHHSTEKSNTARLLLDGRHWAREATSGQWVGPSIILHQDPTDRALHEEIFGPVLSILHVDSFDAALAIENANPFGNAASVYTSIGAHAEYFQTRFRAGMIGVNIGVPVPREPFSFGGHGETWSKYGDMDITGDGCVAFFTHRRKITTKWGPGIKGSHHATNDEDHRSTLTDHANFTGQL